MSTYKENKKQKERKFLWYDNESMSYRAIFKRRDNLIKIEVYSKYIATTR